MKINLLTPIRKGGPYSWGEDLTYMLNKNGIVARHVHSLPMLLEACLFQSADVVHAAVPIPFKLWKRPIVLTIHGDYTVEHNMWQRFYRRTIAEATTITTPSRYLKQKLGLNNAIVIPNAIFPERFKQVRHSEKDRINLATVTQFYFEGKAKGIMNMLEILNAASNMRAMKIKYQVVGGGPYLEQTKTQAKKYNVDVQFTGMIQNPEKILENSDIFVYYSHHDSFGIVLLEAMACGLPVVTNEFGPASEIIENGTDGYIATTDDAYLEYLLNLISDAELRTKIGENARKAVEAKFDWAKIVDEYTKIYKALL
jgi:glycosyltransferase involved in cell wall biosynthesis